MVEVAKLPILLSLNKGLYPTLYGVVATAKDPAAVVVHPIVNPLQEIRVEPDTDSHLGLVL